MIPSGAYYFGIQASSPETNKKRKRQLVPERKVRSGTILDFRLRILDLKKKAISVRWRFLSKIMKSHFEVLGQPPVS